MYVWDKILASFSALIILLYLFNWGNSLPFSVFEDRTMLPWLFFFPRSFCLFFFLITFILPVYYAMEIFYSFAFSILVSLDIYMRFPFYFSEDLQKEIGNFFLTFFLTNIFLWKKVSCHFLSHYFLLTPVLPFSSRGFQITLFSF